MVAEQTEQIYIKHIFVNEETWHASKTYEYILPNSILPHKYVLNMHNIECIFN